MDKSSFTPREWQTVSDVYVGAICLGQIFVCRMGRLCGGAHEISVIFHGLLHIVYPFGRQIFDPDKWLLHIPQAVN